MNKVKPLLFFAIVFAGCFSVPFLCLGETIKDAIENPIEDAIEDPIEKMAGEGIGKINFNINIQVAEPMGRDYLVRIPFENDEIFCRAINKIPTESQNAIYRIFALFNKMIQNKQTLFLEDSYSDNESDSLHNNYFKVFLDESSKPQEIEKAFESYLEFTTEYTNDEIEDLSIFDKEEVILRDLIRYASLSKIKEFIEYLQKPGLEGGPSQWENIMDAEAFPDLDTSFQNPNPNVRKYLFELDKKYEIENYKENLILEDIPKYYEEKLEKVISYVKQVFENVIYYEISDQKYREDFRTPVWAWYYLQNLLIEMETWKEPKTEKYWNNVLSDLDYQYRAVIDHILARTRASISTDCEKYKVNPPPKVKPLSLCEIKKKNWLKDVLNETNNNVVQYALKSNQKFKQTYELYKVFRSQHEDCLFGGELKLIWKDSSIILENSSGIPIRTLVNPSLFSLNPLLFSLQDIEIAMGNTELK